MPQVNEVSWMMLFFKLNVLFYFMILMLSYFFFNSSCSDFINFFKVKKFSLLF